MSLVPRRSETRDFLGQSAPGGRQGHCAFPENTANDYSWVAAIGIFFVPDSVFAVVYTLYFFLNRFS
jgi:hypothetical protein